MDGHVSDLAHFGLRLRAKNVPPTDVEGLFQHAAGPELNGAFMVVLWPSHRALPADMLRQKSLEVQQQNAATAAPAATPLQNVADLLAISGPARSWCSPPAPWISCGTCASCPAGTPSWRRCGGCDSPAATSYGESLMPIIRRSRSG